MSNPQVTLARDKKILCKINWPDTTTPTVSTVNSWFKFSNKCLSSVTGAHTFPSFTAVLALPIFFPFSCLNKARSSISLQKIPTTLAARPEAALEILCFRAVIGGNRFMTHRAPLYCICPCSPHLPFCSLKKKKNTSTVQPALYSLFIP